MNRRNALMMLFVAYGFIALIIFSLFFYNEGTILIVSVAAGWIAIIIDYLFQTMSDKKEKNKQLNNDFQEGFFERLSRSEGIEKKIAYINLVFYLVLEILAVYLFVYDKITKLDFVLYSLLLVLDAGFVMHRLYKFGSFRSIEM